jgi:hypothetical protein
MATNGWFVEAKRDSARPACLAAFENCDRRLRAGNGPLPVRIN